MLNFGSNRDKKSLRPEIFFLIIGAKVSNKSFFLKTRRPQWFFCTSKLFVCHLLCDKGLYCCMLPCKVAIVTMIQDRPPFLSSTAVANNCRDGWNMSPSKNGYCAITYWLFRHIFVSIVSKYTLITYTMFECLGYLTYLAPLFPPGSVIAILGQLTYLTTALNRQRDFPFW